MFEQNTNSPALMASVNSGNGDTTNRPLKYFVQQALRNYLAELNGESIDDLYDVVLSQVEAPLLDVLMQYTRGNQTRAADMMGINRGTLRKKLKKYGMN